MHIFIKRVSHLSPDVLHFETMTQMYTLCCYYSPGLVLIEILGLGISVQCYTN